MLPPFTDLRSVQTLVDGDQLLDQVRRPGRLDARRRRLHRRDLRRRCWPSSAAPTSWSATPSGASTTPRPTSSSTPRRTRRSAAGMTPIVCVGEGLEVRQAGEHVPYTLAQVDGSLAGFTAEQVAGLVVAYEPVWAIGTGEVATPEDAQEVCAAIRGADRARCTATPPRTAYASSTAAR